MKTVIIILFFLLIGLFLIVSLMSAYVFIRYGRTKGVTISITLIFLTLFTIATASTYLILQNLF